MRIKFCYSYASYLVLAGFLAIGFDSMAQRSERKATIKPYALTLTTKFHSTAHSPYSGIYINHHPNAELFLSYKRDIMGGFISKNVDFMDVHSGINFTNVGLFGSIRLNKSLKVVPYIGYVLKQSHSFLDEDSDLWTALVVRVTAAKWIAIENTSLFGNVVQHGENASFSNRLNVAISIGQFKVDVYTWYTHPRIRAPHFVSASLAVTSPDWVITPTVSARIQIAVLQHIANENPAGAMHRGVLVSLIVPIDF
jgi:hypothetical protein